MKDEARRLLAAAKGHIEKGEQFYRQAAAEIVGAKKADPTLSDTQIGEELGKSRTYVRRLVLAATTCTRANDEFVVDWESGSNKRDEVTRSTLRQADPRQLEEIMRGLPVEQRAAVVRAAVPSPDRTPLPKSGPTFIELIVRANSALIELEGMVADWQNLAAVPAEFSRDSFNDIVAKALRIQDRFDALAEAINNEDEDEFQNIVRNFRVVGDVR